MGAKWKRSVCEGTATLTDESVTSLVLLLLSLLLLLLLFLTTSAKIEKNRLKILLKILKYKQCDIFIESNTDCNFEIHSSQNLVLKQAT